MKVRSSRLRVILLIVMVGCAAVAIGARLYTIQVLDSERYRTRAVDQHQDVLTVQATRGKILDRNGEILAVSIEAQSLYAHPRRVDDPDSIARQLAPILETSRRDLAARMRLDKNFVWLGRFLDPDQVEQIRELDLPMGGAEPFGFEVEPKRVYPRGWLANHVVGFANIDGVGVEGIEKQFHEVLHGDPTVYLVLQDAHNGRLKQKVSEPTRRPQDVVLTIDSTLQHIVERELDRAMSRHRALGGTIILLDATTGEVLALANRPGADLNDYGRSTAEQRRNRAVVLQYEPGSTFKAVSMAAALDQKKIGLGQKIYCEEGSYTVDGRTISDVSASGLLTPAEILERSSNIGISKIVRNLEPRRFDEAVRRFGFGRETGIELPGEIPGTVHPPEKWSGTTQDSMAFGQEISVTPLQMVTAMAALANGGLQVPPRVVMGTRDPSGRFHPADSPRPLRVTNRSTADNLTRMLTGVIENGSGVARLEEYRLAGKSGTAQKAIGGRYSATDYVASYTGFGPVDEPRLVGLVVIDTPRAAEHFGSKVAAPVFRRIMLESLRHFRVPSDRFETPRLVRREANPQQLTAHSEPGPAGPPALIPGRVPDLRGVSLRDAVHRLARLGCDPQIEGQGFVVRQQPPPGSSIEAGTPCSLQLSTSPPPSGGTIARRRGRASS